LPTIESVGKGMLCYSGLMAVETLVCGRQGLARDSEGFARKEVGQYGG